jgi:filamentous hemagglutinin family protein
MKYLKIRSHSAASHPPIRRICALILSLTTAFSPALSSAALFPGLVGRTVLPFVPAAGQLPGKSTVVYGSADVNPNAGPNTMTITQNQGDKVIINWDSFNMGKDALVRFYQGTGTPGSADWKPKSGYTALNLIFDANPTVINGRLNADGRVYMINRNGVFFGPDAKVQVQSLVASAFKISDDDFKKGLLRFGDPADPDQPAADATISNEGSITTNSGGSVFFVGPKIQNLGTISAPAGKIDLVGLTASGQVRIVEIPENRGDQVIFYTDPSKAGDVANMKTGSMFGDDGGWIGLYGKTVRNDGLIRAVTSRSKNGVIVLAAKNLVATGEGSATEVEVSGSEEAMGQTAQKFTAGLVKFTGLPGSTALERIDHEGRITAHSGEVIMEAAQRVFLGERSIIDVSGLTIERPMSDQFVEVKLNGLYLRDDYGQKDNKLLLGSDAWVDVVKGSNVGNLTDYYLNMPKNARDLSIWGGSISITAPDKTDPATARNYTLGDLIISKCAEFNLSGGKVSYSGSAPASTKLIGADGRVYDISNAPKWLSYTGILGKSVKSYGKFGNEVLIGKSFGGHLLHQQNSLADRIVGGSAGSLTLSAGVISGLVDGLNLKAAYTTGINQTVSTPHLDNDKNYENSEDSANIAKYQRYLDYLGSRNRGLEAPTGARFTIGNQLSTDLSSVALVRQDAAVNSIEVKKSVQTPAQHFTWDDDTLLSGSSVTEISADMISKAGLSGLALNANAVIKTEQDAEIILRPGGSTWAASDSDEKIFRPAGSYTATARRIEFLGSVAAAGGSVEMVTRPNITSFAAGSGKDVRETIYLGGESRISTAGERIDNSLIGLSPLDVRKGGRLNGGYISLQQLSEGITNGPPDENVNSVVVSQGALLDVSGGYLIDGKGAVSGGNAGTLKVQAHTISLGGDLRGFSLPGKDGGEVILHARSVQVAEQGRQVRAGFAMNDQLDQELVGRLVLGSDRFNNTGFSRFTLNASDNLTVAAGVQLSPSLLKSDLHNRTVAGAVCRAGSCFSAAYPNPQDQAGKSSITLNAGKNVYGSGFLNTKLAAVTDNDFAKLTIEAGATVATETGGKVTLNAPERIELAGTVRTPGGTVKAVSKNHLTVMNTGRIDAAGYYKYGIATKADQPAPLPVAIKGGEVTLEASAGNLELEAGSSVDVSGSARIESQIRDAHGVLTTAATAGDAGSLTLAYGADLVLNGAIAGAGGNLAGTRGGSLTVEKKVNDLVLSASDVGRYQNSGFDALTFSSPNRIIIPAKLDISVGRSLTLKGQLIQGTGTGSDAASLRAPWITLDGIVTDAVPATATDSSSGAVSFSGRYLDVKGGVLMEGFSAVSLQAERDLTFSDSFYGPSGGISSWNGYLKTTAANLTLQAGRIFPTTAANFTITTPGKTTILPGVANSAPIYSAGGKLTVSANGGIYHGGFLAAPLGDITLDSGAGRLDLTAESVTTTAGSVPVAYGVYDSSKWWAKYVDNSNTGTEVVTAAPAKSISLKGREIVVQDGALQDLSGGGSVYAANFQPGIPGSRDPFTISGRFVILPDGSATRPGDSVYLEAMPSLGLKAGFYSKLPAEFAFVPGALVIEDTGKQLLAGQRTLSKERYPVVGGYMTVGETVLDTQAYKGFSVRRAEEVRKEGDFTVKSFVGGDGGSFAFNATGTVARFDGRLLVNPLAGYRPGNVSFVADRVEVVESATAGSTALQLDGNMLTGLRIGTLQLGDATATSDVTVQKLSGKEGLTAGNVTLSANGSVTLEDGAEVHADNGTASIVTPTGTFTLGAGAKLTAQNGGVKLDVNNTALKGTIDAGANGSFSVTANGIKFDDASTLDGYFHMTSALETLFSKYKSFTIASRGDIEFLRDVDLTTGSLTIDAARYVGATTVNFSAADMTLLNSVKTFDTVKNPLSKTGGSLSFNAQNITIAPRVDTVKVKNVLEKRGSIAFDKFGTVNIKSTNDLVLKGEGTIATGGDLTLAAARVTTASDRYKADGSYTVANITVDGRNGAVTLNGSAKGKKGTGSTPGGSLQILGNSITQNGGILDVAAGQIGLTATGDITIKSAISATGSEQVSAAGEKVYFNGGKIALQSDGGKVELQSGASLDVSAAVVTDTDGKVMLDADGNPVRRGDAGAISLSSATAGKGVSIKKEVAVNGVVTEAGARLAGIAGSGGRGGSFSIDSATLAGVAGLNGLSSILATRTLEDKTITGGFDNLLDIRSRAGDLTLSGGSTITGRNVVIAADNGSITTSGITVTDAAGNAIKDTNGNDVIRGGINADTADASGSIELYVDKSLTIGDKSTLSARGTDAGSHGGSVELSSRDGSDNSKTFNGVYALNVNSGSTINVAGNGGGGGTAHFRAYQNVDKNDVNVGSINGTISGAARVSVEAVQAKAYANTTNVGMITNYKDHAVAFMSAAATANTKKRLFGSTAGTVNHLQAGIEISSAANTSLTVDQALDFSGVLPGGEAVVLTLKSAKDLKFSQSLIDAPTAMDVLHSSTMVKNSTAFNLVAGHDGGANYRGVSRGSALAKDAAGNASPLSGTGDLTIAKGKWVYTENGPVRFAAGNDVILSGTTSGPGTMINTDMKYNLGSYAGSVRGDVGRDLKLEAVGSAIQTALGNIDVRTGRDLKLGTLASTGAIRTTGEFDNTALTAKQPGLPVDTVANSKSYWTYHNGGNISLDVGNAVDGNLKETNGWDGAYVDGSLYDKGLPTVSSASPWFYLTAGFGGSRETGQAATVATIPVTVGIATMGGGDVSVRTGGLFKSQVGVFGTSHADTLTINSGADMVGRYRVMNGTAKMTSGGDFGKDDFKANPTWRSTIELANAQVHVAAMGDVRLGTVQNPDNSRDRLYYKASDSDSTKPWNMTYFQGSATARETGFTATSLTGDTTLFGTNKFDGYSGFNEKTAYLNDRRIILPPSVSLSAAGDIDVKDNFVLAPSEKGNLVVAAGGSIRGVLSNSWITGFKMQDVNIASMYGRQAEDTSGTVHSNQLKIGDVHNGINHLNDTERVKVSAGKDIIDFNLYLNKPAEVKAGGDIIRLKFMGQNTVPGSVTSITAGGNIDQGTTLNPRDGDKIKQTTPSIELGGPGTLLVQAGTALLQPDGSVSESTGGNIRLGNSGGIASVGNTYNSQFSGSGAETDSDLIVIAGANGGASVAKPDVEAFFAVIKDASDRIPNLKAEGKTAEADRLLAETEQMIRTYFYTYNKKQLAKYDTVGNLDLVESAISSRTGSIYAMAGSNVNVGKTAMSNAPLTASGITTLYGGGLSVYAGNDVNVNESRLMTYLGGDITVWSDQGDINAGRGSKTVVSAPTPVNTFDSNKVLVAVSYTPPSAGSGISALTFDTDGSGPIAAPERGKVFIHAPGTVDGGEAGIVGSTISVDAGKVLNSQNIVSSAGSVGVPTSSQNTVSIGPMTGATDMTNDKKMIETISGGGSDAAKKTVLAEAEAFLMKYLDVKVVDLTEGTL